MSVYSVAFAPVVVRSAYTPVAPFRWILKPVSLLELSVQADNDSVWLEGGDRES